MFFVNKKHKIIVNKQIVLPIYIKHKFYGIYVLLK